MNNKYFEKLHIKTVINLNSVPLYQISVNLENIRFWNQIYPKLYKRSNFEKINIKIVIGKYNVPLYVI